MTASALLTLCSEHLLDSPYVFTAFGALTEKVRRFETVALALDQAEQRRPQHRDRSLAGTVATFVDHPQPARLAREPDLEGRARAA